MEKPLVSICCITYNHERYIKDALEGFLKQKTNFPYEIVISDDCSKDGTRKIIEEYKLKYPTLMRDISPKENMGAIPNFFYVQKNAFGKFIALCEGDDYWTDPLKLQKQVDILERDERIGFCFSRVRVLNHATGEIDSNVMSEDASWNFETLLLDEPPITSTAFFRFDLFSKYFEDIKPERYKWLMGDTPLWLYLAAVSKVAFLPDITSTYRVLELSASHTGDLKKRILFNQSARDIRLFFCDMYYPERKDWVRAVKEKYYRWNMYDAVNYGDWQCAIKNWIKLKHKKKVDLCNLIMCIRDNYRPIRRTYKLYKRLVSKKL